jgi:hypothetical protein
MYITFKKESKMKTANLFKRATKLAAVTVLVALILSLTAGCSKSDGEDDDNNAAALTNGEKFAKELCDCAKKTGEQARETCAYDLGLKYALQMYNPQTGAIDQKFFDDYEAWLVKNCTSNWEDLD